MDQQSQPVHLHVREVILGMIEGPDYGPGDKIPSERSLSETLGISRMTVRRAIDDLVRDGVLERRSTSGTHIATPNVIRPLDLGRAIGISQVVKNAGANPGSRLLFFESATASSTLAKHLRIPGGSPLIMIRRLRTADGLPFCLETSYLPAERVPGLAAADLVENPSLFDLLRSRYGIGVGRRSGVIGIAPIQAGDAALLGIEPDINVLVYRLDVYDDQDRPIEHMISINHPQRVVFTTRSGTESDPDVTRTGF